MPDPKGPEVILASASPRRRELSGLVCENVTVIPAEGDESTDQTAPADIVRELAERKAAEVAANAPGDSIVIGADTVVAADGVVLGKPTDPDDAERMLRMLSGRSHQVFTGIAVLYGQRRVVDCEVTTVEFCAMTDEEIRSYVATKEPMDKAGAYGIQGGAARFVSRIDGCYYNVMGLPVHRLYEILKSL